MLLHCLFLFRRHIICETVEVCWTVHVAEAGGTEVRSEIQCDDGRAQCQGQ